MSEADRPTSKAQTTQRPRGNLWTRIAVGLLGVVLELAVMLALAALALWCGWRLGFK
jgi:hypothetical protein